MIANLLKKLPLKPLLSNKRKRISFQYWLDTEILCSFSYRESKGSNRNKNKKNNKKKGMLCFSTVNMSSIDQNNVFYCSIPLDQIEDRFWSNSNCIPGIDSYTLLRWARTANQLRNQKRHQIHPHNQQQFPMERFWFVSPTMKLYISLYFMFFHLSSWFKPSTVWKPWFLNKTLLSNS